MGKYIKVFNNRDKDAFNGFRNCGHLDHNHLKSFGLSETKIKNLCRENLIQKCAYDIKGSRENGLCYKLTDKGKELGTSKWGLNNYVQSVNTHARHNLDVANKFLSLSKEERACCMNERDLRDMAQEKINLIEEKQERDHYQELLDNSLMSMPDIAYVSREGQTIAYETTTNNYGEIEIEAKEQACEFLEMELIQNKI